MILNDEKPEELDDNEANIFQNSPKAALGLKQATLESSMKVSTGGFHSTPIEEKRRNNSHPDRQAD